MHILWPETCSILCKIMGFHIDFSVQPEQHQLHIPNYSKEEKNATQAKIDKFEHKAIIIEPTCHTQAKITSDLFAQPKGQFIIYGDDWVG